MPLCNVIYYKSYNTIYYNISLVERDVREDELARGLVLVEHGQLLAGGRASIQTYSVLCGMAVQVLPIALLCFYTYVYIYIYMYRERDIDIDIERKIYISLYIYIYIERERKRDIDIDMYMYIYTYV